MPTVFAWQSPPTATELIQASTQADHLIIGLHPHQRPDWTDHPTLAQALSCLQHTSLNVIPHILGNATLWLIPEPHISQLHAHFGHQPIHWQTPAVPQQPIVAEKPWFQQPPHTASPEHVIVVGAGIAGASTAYELAQRGIAVTVLESASAPATRASGNRQGLLYAKISPHNTPQTELLLSGYGYTRHLIPQLLPNAHTWGATGVLHLNHNPSETQRNTALAQHHWHQHLYHSVTAEQASDIAGIAIHQDGLYWQQGAWLNPPALIHALLAHANITVHTDCTVHSAEHDGQIWHVHTTQGTHTASHIVFCTGANNPDTPIIRKFPFQMIRGQTTLAPATEYSSRLKIALSGASYISPAWDNQHCFGATFIPNDTDPNWREQDDQQNWAELNELAPALNFDPKYLWRGHTAIRCDSHDHLPVVGALGNPTAMRNVYAKLALDKNYRLNDPCPYYPNVYTNTAHGSRGLATAPLCAMQIASEICGTPQPLSPRLRQALHPNRLIIRQIVRHSTR